MTNHSTKRVLCYIRPWSVEQFDILARGAFPGAQVTTISDHLGMGDICLSDVFYAGLDKAGIEQEAASLVTDAERKDIISRCRLLRMLPRARAERLLAAMAVSINRALDQAKPDYILSYTVDGYVLDLLLHLGAKRGIPFIGLAAIFANGYFRVTARGEYNATGNAETAAIDASLDELLRTDYKPIYISVGPHGIHSDRGLYSRSIERWAKNFLRIGYFELKRMFGRDRANFHCIGTIAAARTWLQALPSFTWTRDWQARFARHQGRRFYIPLQWTPESSIDYWCPQLEAIDYDSRIPEVVAIASRHGQVVVKEHPAFWGYRLSRFYRRLMSDNVIIPPANASSIGLIASSDWVMVYTGSAGFEAALRGKQVVTLGNPYYRSGRFIHAIEDVRELEALLSDPGTPPPITRQEQHDMMKHVLDGALPGRFRDDGSFKPGNAEHIAEAEGVARSLRSYIEAGPALWRPASSPALVTEHTS